MVQRFLLILNGTLFCSLICTEGLGSEKMTSFPSLSSVFMKLSPIYLILLSYRFYEIFL